MKLSKTLAIALEAVGCCVIIGGIAIEVTMGADIGYIAITAGALAIAFGGMVFTKLLKRKKPEE
jgi:hypothetical protein